MKPLYFDHNATTPVAESVFEAMKPYLTTEFGNPGSGYDWGRQAARAAAEAREQVAGLLKAKPEEIYFTSCATESNNTVLFGRLAGRSGAGLVISAVEHPAIIEPAKVLEKQGIGVTVVPVTDQGLVEPDKVAAACDEKTDLVSIMLANNETGAIQPIRAIADLVRRPGLALHTDASQAVGKIAVEVDRLGVDLLTLAGHKLYAPKGIGALYIRSGVELSPLLYGGGQERGLRSGTENVAYMVGLGAACALAARDVEAEEARQRALAPIILEALGQPTPYRINSDQAPRLPNTLSLSFLERKADSILELLYRFDAAASAGAACHDDTADVSHVLEAMNLAPEWSHGTIRVSWGRSTTEEDAADFGRRLAEAVALAEVCDLI